MSVYSRVLRYIAPYWAQTLTAAVLMLFAIGLKLLQPWPFKYIVDGVLPGGTGEGVERARAFVAQWIPGEPSQQILWLCLALVGISLAWGLVNLASNYLFLKTGLRCLLRLRQELYAWLQGLPLKFHDSRRSSDSAFRVAYDSQSVQTIYNKGFAGVLSAVVTLGGALVIMLALDWKLTLAALVVLPFLVLAIRYYAVRVRKLSKNIQERESDLLGLVQEGLNFVRMVQAFGRENYEVRQFRLRALRSLDANLRLNVTSVTSALVVGALMASGTALLYYVGARQVLDGNLTLGDLLVFAAYLVMLYQPLEQLSYTAWALEGAAAGAQRCFEVLDSANDVPETPGARKLERVRGALRFEDVEFGYESERPILRSVSFTTEPGEILGIVGGTGAGKSTLLSLIPRFYDPGAGCVRLDGQDIRSATKKSLREQISIVLQDTLLFSTSIRENIAYGRPGASTEEIEQAARQAQAWDFIAALSEGLDSQVGERGTKLSVGQRQRIGIARAFLKDAPILLLDEPTSALDAATERSIMEAIAGLMRGRTTLLVTHRLATVANLPRVLVLETGRVVEDGPPAELLKQGGFYARLHGGSSKG